MKRFFTSYIVSVPMLVVGVVFMVQASNNSFVASADAVSGMKNSGIVLMIFGTILIVLAMSLMIINYSQRRK